MSSKNTRKDTKRKASRVIQLNNFTSVFWQEHEFFSRYFCESNHANGNMSQAVDQDDMQLSDLPIAIICLVRRSIESADFVVEVKVFIGFLFSWWFHLIYTSSFIFKSGQIMLRHFIKCC